MGEGNVEVIGGEETVAGRALRKGGIARGQGAGDGGEQGELGGGGSGTRGSA